MFTALLDVRKRSGELSRCRRTSQNTHATIAWACFGGTMASTPCRHRASQPVQPLRNFAPSVLDIEPRSVALNVFRSVWCDETQNVRRPRVYFALRELLRFSKK